LATWCALSPCTLLHIALLWHESSVKRIMLTPLDERVLLRLPAAAQGPVLTLHALHLLAGTMQGVAKALKKCSFASTSVGSPIYMAPEVNGWR